MIIGGGGAPVGLDRRVRAVAERRRAPVAAGPVGRIFISI
jgi:hypothetical protein